MGEDEKTELDLFDYTTKADLKNSTGVDTLKFTKKGWFSKLKFKTDKLNVVELETTPADLSKLSNVAKNKVVKKTEYDELIKS